jgi:hypothetical protein
MPKILIKGKNIPKAKNGQSVSNGPCEKGYINIDGYCIPLSESSEYSYWEIPNKPGYYTTDRKAVGVSEGLLPMVTVQSEDPYKGMFPPQNWFERTTENVGDFFRGGPKDLNLDQTRSLDRYWRQALADDNVRKLLSEDPKYYQSLRLEAYKSIGAPESVMQREACLSNFGYHWDEIKKTCVPDIAQDKNGEDTYRTIDAEFYKSQIAPTLLSYKAPIRLSKHQDVISTFIPENELAFDTEWDDNPDVHRYKLQYHPINGTGQYNPELYDFSGSSVAAYANATDDEKMKLDEALREKAQFTYKNQVAIQNLSKTGAKNVIANNLPGFMGGWDRKAWGNPANWDRANLQEQVEQMPGFDPDYSWEEQVYLLDDQLNKSNTARNFMNTFTGGLNAASKNRNETPILGPIVNLASDIGTGTFNDWMTGSQIMAGGLGVPGTKTITRSGLSVDDPNQITKEPRNQYSVGLAMLGRTPNLTTSLENVVPAYKSFVQNPSVNTGFGVFGATVDPIWQSVLAAPISSFAKAPVNMAAKEVPLLTRIGTGAKEFTLGSGYSNLGNLGKGYRVVTSPLRAGKNAFMGYMHGATGVTTGGISNLYPGLLGTSFRGTENVWEDATGTTPFGAGHKYLIEPTISALDKLIGKGKKQEGVTKQNKTVVQCGEGYIEDPNNPGQCIPIVPSGYTNQNDTLYNFNLNNNTQFSLDTRDPDDKEIFNLLKTKKIVNFDVNGYNPETGMWNVQGIPKEAETLVNDLLQLKTESKAYGGPTSEIPKLFSYSPEKNIPGRMNNGGSIQKMNLGGPKVRYRCGPNGVEAFDSKDATQTSNSPFLDPTKSASIQSALSVTNMLSPTGNMLNSAGVPGAMVKDFSKQSSMVFDSYQEAVECCTKGNCKQAKKSFGDKMQDFSTNFDAYTNLGSGISSMYSNIGKAKQNELSQRRQNLTDNLDVVSTDAPGSKGFYQTNTGVLMPDQLGYDTQNVGMFGGTMLKDSNMSKTIKIKILGGPTGQQMAYGGQSGYGFDLGQRNTYTAMPKGKADTVSKTIQEVPREQANIEAEKGETIYADVDGDGMYEHLNIEGRRHTQGGTPLDVPEGSFVFSDTAKMRIKDPATLNKFGLSVRKGGYTPAEIAKKYDVNKYKGILQDSNSDQMMKNTAMLMIKSFQRKLAELALIQESMKGFPQGIPEMCRGVLPDEMLAAIEQQIQEQGGGEQQPEEGNEQQQPELTPEEQAIMSQEDMMMPEEQGMAMEEQPMGRMGGMYAYGGFVDEEDEYDDYYNYSSPLYRMNGGGGTPGSPGKWEKAFDDFKTKFLSADYDDVRENLWNKYKTANPTDAAKLTEEQYINIFLESQRQKYVFHQEYETNPGYLTTDDWNTTKGGTKNKKYAETVAEMKKRGYTDFKPLTSEDIKRSQEAYIDLTQLTASDPNTYGKRILIKNIGKPLAGQRKSFGVDANGKPIENISHVDGIMGFSDVGSMAMLPDPEPVVVKQPDPKKGYRCTGRDPKTKEPIIEPKEFKDDTEMTAAGYVADPAQVKCPDIPGTPPGDPPVKNPPTEVPFKYMTPDKWKMATAMGAIGNVSYPYIADTNYERGKFQPEEWRAKASQLESLAKQTSEQMGTYLPGNQSAANVTNMFGQQAGNLIGAIADVDARNIQGYNAYNAREMARKDAYKQQRAANATGRATGTAIARQASDNFLNAKMNNVTNAAANAWNNRMQLAKINETNRYYYTDPTSGQTIWKGGYGPEDLGQAKGSNMPTWKQYQDMFPGQAVTPKDYNDYIKAVYSKQDATPSKYGGPANIKFNNFGMGGVAQMLENGYGFPY